ncbi:MAG: esterase/lipase family protein, partial [Actinomycetota bacterium]
MKRYALAMAAAIAAVVVAGCTSTPATDDSSTQPNRAVVLVSGGATSTPFTTPTQACKDGEGYLAAGNTNTDIRSYLLQMGKQVYTSPVMDTWGPVVEPTDDRPGPFADCPLVLPATMTITSTADLTAGGERLARFLTYLNTEYGITDVDLVGHSNGGLWSRSAIWVLKNTGSPITVRSLTMMGTPNDGSVPGRYTVGEITLDTCRGNAYCIDALKQWSSVVDSVDKGLNLEDTQRFLDGPGGWNAAQGNVLEGIPVTLIAGTYFSDPQG